MFFHCHRLIMLLIQSRVTPAHRLLFFLNYLKRGNIPTYNLHMHAYTYACILICMHIYITVMNT